MSENLTNIVDGGMHQAPDSLSTQASVDAGRSRKLHLPEVDRQLIAEWNQTARPYPDDRCLHELIEAQVARSPSAVALVCGANRVTYGEMNRRANQLAHYLQTRGIQPEMLVGIVAERSLETVIAILAVLKAGGAYVPLDPNYPPSRLEFMITDSGTQLLLTHSAVRDRFPIEDQAIVTLDDWSQFASLPTTNSAPTATPAHLAYLIYTSGSTGLPKGVLVPHRQIVHSTSARFVYDQECPPIAYLLLPSFSFDGSGGGMYWTLCRGGRLVIPTTDQHQDLILLRQLIAQEQISHLDCTSSLYTLILDTDASHVHSLRHTILGGEICPPELVAQHYRLLPNTRLINDYGPTETTIWCTRFECRPENATTATIPIGQPIPNTQIYVLDDQLCLTPISMGGELYIGGDGVTRGYLNQPALTAGRFIPNPFVTCDDHGLCAESQDWQRTTETSTTPGPGIGARLYRTGDLARYLPDGNLEFLGRNDSQVKIRGYRIELDEIENTLLGHPEIMQAAIVVRGSVAEHQQLIGYLVSSTGAALAREKLVEFLLERLPSYMIPQVLVFLDRLPQSPSGKVDRRALAALAIEPQASETSFVAPQTPLEQAISAIVATILGIERIGIHDNFFELGGNSLLLIQVMNYLSRHYDVHLPVAHIFEVPTVAGVTQIVDSYQNEGHDNIVTQDMTQIEVEAFLDPKISPEWQINGG